MVVGRTGEEQVPRGGEAQHRSWDGDPGQPQDPTSDWQHTSAWLFVTHSQHRCCFTRWGDTWRHQGEETPRLFITLELGAEDSLSVSARGSGLCSGQHHGLGSAFT